MGSMVWKMMGTGGAVLAGIAAKKVATTAWTKSTGKNPPDNPEDPETGWGEALAWALVTGALIGIAKMLTSRKAANYYRKSTGHLPPGVSKRG